MKRQGLGSWLPVVVAASVTLLGGCQKAKDALKEAAKEFGGIEELTKDDITKIKSEVKWDDAKMAKYEIVNGFRLSDKFQGNLSSSVKIPVPFDLDEKAKGAAEAKGVSYALLKKETFEVGANKFTRFMIVSVAKYDAAEKSLVISGEELAKYMDPKQMISPDNKNQAGEYLLAKASGTGGIAYLSGDVNLKKTDATENKVGDAVIFSSESPFVTRSGASGKYLLAVLEGDKGFLTASKPAIVSEAQGTPTSTQTEIPYTGVLEEYKGAYNDKVKTTGADAAQTAKSEELFSKANTVITDFLGAWKMGTAHLTFVQPPLPPETPLPEPPVSPDPPADAPVTPEPPAANDPTIDPTPAADSQIVRGDVDGPQVNLGCTYVAGQSSLVNDPSKFDDYTTTKGWRFVGDVRITNEMAASIFGIASERNTSDPRNIDQADGYCLLTTGNQLYNNSVSNNNTAGIFAPVSGKTSEMWQKVKVPADAKAIQVRVAFFSQEFPRYVGSQYNDAFYVKFDESPNYIAQGNLNDLGGEVAGCGNQELPETCGEWKSIASETNLHGELWNIALSTEAPPQGDDYGCLSGTSSNKRCYHGWVPPRVICRTLDAETEVGKELTLRIGVTDMGDSYYDSAVAVDSVVFSKEAEDPCAAGNLFSGDEASRVNSL